MIAVLILAYLGVSFWACCLTFGSSELKAFDTDDYLELVCRANGIDEFLITGDSYAVPCMEEKIDSLVLKLGGVVPPEPTE